MPKELKLNRVENLKLVSLVPSDRGFDLIQKTLRGEIDPESFNHVSMSFGSEEHCEAFADS